MTIGGKNIMLDCGMHMGYNDEVTNVCITILLACHTIAGEVI